MSAKLLTQTAQATGLVKEQLISVLHISQEKASRAELCREIKINSVRMTNMMIKRVT